MKNRFGISMCVVVAAPFALLAACGSSSSGGSGGTGGGSGSGSGGNPNSGGSGGVAAAAGRTGSGGSSLGGSANDAGPGTVTSCPDVQGSCNYPGSHICEDYAGLDSTALSNLQAGCTVTGVFSTSPCVTSGYVAASILQTGGTCQASWLFPGYSQLDLSGAMTTCKASPYCTWLTAGQSGSGGSSVDGSTADTGTPALGGCPNVQGSCNEAAFSTCADVSGYDSAELSSLQTNCAVGGIGVFSTSPCDTSGYVGACKVLSAGGQCETVWYSTQAFATANMASCSGAGETWLSR